MNIRIEWLQGTTRLPRGLGAYEQDDDGWWRELFTPWRDEWPGGFREREFTAVIRWPEPMGRVATQADLQRATPRADA